MTPLLVYITCADLDEARKIGDSLLQRRLAACVNILESPVQSLYLWKGQQEEGHEVLLLAKTVDARFAELNKAVRGLHSYETPCVAALPLVDGDPDFLAWIEDCTSDNP